MINLSFPRALTPTRGMNVNFQQLTPIIPEVEAEAGDLPGVPGQSQGQYENERRETNKNI